MLKVHSRCDLACDHCYIYRHADQGWRRMPLAMSAETVDWAGRRIAEHAVAHGLPEVCIILHGGEPLLLGVRQARVVLETLRARLSPVTAIDLRIVTNGVRLNEQWCRLFAEYGVKVGVSLDGDQVANDRHRRFRSGRSSYAQVNRALSLLREPEFRHLYAGILCTIDISNDPEAVYDALVAQAPPRLDLLLPHATWRKPPYRLPGPDEGVSAHTADTAYADWLLRIYRRWTRESRPVPIRLFDSLLSAAHGGPSFTEAFGTDSGDVLVIETDGSWEQPDSMKTAHHGAAATAMRVTEQTVDDVSRHPQIAARQGGIDALCATCRACPVVRICGGGLYAHRYGPGGFDNPSVYCADLKELITKVIADDRNTRRVIADDRHSRRPTHQLPAEGFAAFAAGPGDVVSLRELDRAWESQTRALVAAVAANKDVWCDEELRAATAAGWELLCSLDQQNAQAVRHVLSNPCVAAWAIRCLRPSPGADLDLDRAHLAGLALAAAVRAGVTVDLSVPRRNGRAHLPGVGAMVVPSDTPRVVVLRAHGGRVVTGGIGRWLQTRQLDTGELRGVVIEDLDPFRDCYDWPVTARLSTSQWQAWRRGLAGAGRILAEAVPSYLDVMAEGSLRAVVPLRAAPGKERAATARQAFGSVAVAFPARDDVLAELLLHEFQHVKLNALTDLYPMVSASARPVLLRVPWRPDPRPVVGALHGVYAFLALTGLRQAIGPRQRFLRYRSWVLEVTESLLASHALTVDGERFVVGIVAAASADAGAGAG
ncbi:MAG TPA: FxsB family cyclophane-forming radical SAM/SPASM peptide maturase [Streptosporangiaceae bacterium]|nr:FxsB family cyclophane-forming radical SAM/SPASM peptide maturase [Streptosporangiaceae bacterium]